MAGSDPDWLANLRRLAQEATPGPWKRDGDDVEGSDGRSLLYTEYSMPGLEADHDAAFIAAANPQTVAWLLDMLAKAMAFVDVEESYDTDDNRRAVNAARDNFLKGPP